MPPPPPPQQRKPQDVSAAQKERNEYIPSFISKKPFYVADEDSSDADYLDHQRLQRQNEQSQQKWYDRGRKQGPAATKFRKGACENCGAMTHKTKDCLSRPRKHGAKWTGKDIQADEVIQDVKLGWDAKRDRWNGYDASEYRHVLEEYNALEEMKKQAKPDTENSAYGSEDDNEGAKYEEETDMGRQQSTSTRNLRIREDTAKYLLNLDLDSAKYDPKTRSMVDSGATADQSAALVAEEGFMKASGDAAEFDKAQKYAWEMQERGDKNKIHLQANPTSGEYFRKKEMEEMEAKRAAQRKALMDKYGSQDGVQNKQARDTAVMESERFVEYDEKGGVKGAPKLKTRSQYAEDVLVNNHTTVWGSWWKDFKWGYACCHATVKNSYCTGEQGRSALDETDRLKGLEVREVPKEIAWKEEEEQSHIPNSVDTEEKTRLDVEARKRKLDGMKNGVSEDDLEAYRRKRVKADDPMRDHLGRDELVH